MNRNDIYGLFNIASAIFEIVPVVVLLLVFKKLHRIYFSLAILICLALITEVINYFLMRNSINNYDILRIYTFIEITLISFFYFKFFGNFFASKVFLIPIPLFLLVAFIDYKINGLDHFDNYATAFEAITFSIFALWSFYYIIKRMIFGYITKAPFFWINTAILLYFGGNLILFVFNNYLLTKQTENHLAMWGIHSVLNIFYNILIAIGFWKTKRH